MKYEAPACEIALLWDDPLLKSQGGTIITPEDIFGN